MKTLLVLLLWFSVGIGVLIGYAERHHRPLPEKDGELLFLVLIWPSIVTVEIYNAIAEAGR